MATRNLAVFSLASLSVSGCALILAVLGLVDSQRNAHTNLNIPGFTQYLNSVVSGAYGLLDPTVLTPDAAGDITFRVYRSRDVLYVDSTFMLVRQVQYPIPSTFSSSTKVQYILVTVYPSFSMTHLPPVETILRNGTTMLCVPTSQPSSYKFNCPMNSFNAAAVARDLGFTYYDNTIIFSIIAYQHEIGASLTPNTIIWTLPLIQASVVKEIDLAFEPIDPFEFKWEQGSPG